MAYEFVSFDLDGTLVDTLDSLTLTGNAWLNTLGYKPLSRDLYRYFVGNGVRCKLQRILRYLEDGRANDENFIDCNMAVYRSFFAQYACTQLQVPPQLPQLLLRLAKEHIHYVVLTNKDEATAKQVLEVAYRGTGVHFPIVCGNSGKYPLKPNPQALLDLLEMELVPAKAALHIGDSDTDMFTAKRAEVTAVGVLWGFRDANELQLSGADYLVNTVQELEKIIFKDGQPA